MSDNNEKMFHSCYVVDVKVRKSSAEILDSARGRWNVDLEDEDLKKQFKSWFQNVFLKGLPQTLTIFEYEDRGKDGDFDFWIEKFCNLPASE